MNIGGPACLLTVEEWRAIADALRLTPREMDIVRCFLRGQSETAAGRTLGISINTVHTHLGRIYRKLEVRSAMGLVVRVFCAYVEHVRIQYPLMHLDFPDCKPDVVSQD